MKIYFAGSIRGGKPDRQAFRQIIAHLKRYGKVLTEHIGEVIPGESDLIDEEIYERDVLWLREADALVAEVTSPSLGVGYEIGKAEEWGKPVLCLYREAEGRRLSAMIRGNKNLVVKKFETMKEASEIIDNFIIGCRGHSNL